MKVVNLTQWVQENSDRLSPKAKSHSAELLHSKNIKEQEKASTEYFKNIKKGKVG